MGWPAAFVIAVIVVCVTGLVHTIVEKSAEIQKLRMQEPDDESEVH
jgi:hypothetical protein